MIRIDRLKANGWGPLRDVDLDLSGLSGVVAICGPNGSGKSTALELVPGALYRETPSRGALAKIATVKGATLELTARGGLNNEPATIIARHVVDATTKTPRQEAVLIVDGKVSSGKVKDFDEAAAQVFPPVELYMASAFSAQGGMGAFADLGRDERRQVLARLLGLERLQALSDAAKDRRKATEAEIALLAARIADLSVGVPACLESELAKAHANREADEEYLRTLDTQRAAKQREVAECEAALASVERDRQEWAKRRERRESLTLLADRTAQEIERSQRAGIDAANLALQLAEAERITAEAEALTPRIADLKAQIAAIVEQGKAKKAERDRADREASDLYTLLHRAEEIRAAARLVAELTVSVGQYTVAVTDAEKALQEAREDAERADRVESDMLRLGLQLDSARESASALDRVPCGGDGTYGSCPLIAQAIEARATIEGLKHDLDGAREHLDAGAQQRFDAAILHHREVRDQLARLRVDLDTARAKAADAGRLDDAEARATALRAQIDALDAELAPLRERHATLDADLRDITLKIAGCQREMSVKCPAGVRLTQEHAATARAEAGYLDERRQRLGGIRADLDVLGDLGSEPSAHEAQGKLRSAQIDAGGVSREIVDVQRRRDETIKRVATLEATAEQARGSAEKKREAEEERGRLLQVAADWDLVERGFGKSGIQALLIDAAGPSISNLCNRLLDVTFGSRFRVSLETTKLDSTGKRLLETLDLRVLDAERGRDGTIDTLSGGEKVIVGLALRLALCLHHGAGAGFGQLFVDELDGALDTENATRFVPVLRRAMELGNLHQILFVSHRSICCDAADHMIEIRDGRAEVIR